MFDSTVLVQLGSDHIVRVNSKCRWESRELVQSGHLSWIVYRPSRENVDKVLEVIIDEHTFAQYL